MMPTSMCLRGTVLLVITILFHALLLQCEAFTNQALFRRSHFNLPKISQSSTIITSTTTTTKTSTSSTARNVLAEPPRDVGMGDQNFHNNNNRRRHHQHRRPIIKRRNPDKKKEEVLNSGRWEQAVDVETKLLTALEALQMSVKMMEGEGSSNNNKKKLIVYPLPFPGIRECNAALATFGDGEDLLRALRMYFKMKKAASLNKRHPPRTLATVPAPTLVTYSTLMSRAVHLGKPQVALRLWNIMRDQPDFFSSSSSASVLPLRRIIPDVKAANILMNCYAKLGYLDAAQDLLDQMLNGGGKDVPRIEPNLVTYNTLLDACHQCGELDSALRVKEYIELNKIRPDARTYTTLIATVSRKASVASGVNDPSLAFSLLQEMYDLHIRPNGMTYCALIDACGRCHRSDLALKGLRMMLDQKAQEQSSTFKKSPASAAAAASASEGRYTLSNEVGAWTAAINACGKAGRIDTAVKLFYSMPNFGVNPNTVTCGCLVDCLLKNGRVSESLNLLRYMKKNRIAPSEVMYTSLMTCADRLAQSENEKGSVGTRKIRTDNNNNNDNMSEARAVDVYAELMGSLMQTTTKTKRSFNGIETPILINNKGQDDDSNEVYRVYLVFQEMKAAGVQPDLACYNALLRSCANAGDVRRAEEVMRQIAETEDLEPNSKTWREMMKAAGKAGRIDTALSTWKAAVEQIKERKIRSVTGNHAMDTETLGVLLSVLVGSAGDERVDQHTVQKLHQVVLKIYESIVSGSNFLGMDLLDRHEVLSDPKLMLTFLHAIVSLEKLPTNDGNSPTTTTAAAATTTTNLDSLLLKQKATKIVMLDCLRNGIPGSLRNNLSLASAYRTSQQWWRESNQQTTTAATDHEKTF